MVGEDRQRAVPHADLEAPQLASRRLDREGLRIALDQRHVGGAADDDLPERRQRVLLVSISLSASSNEALGGGGGAGRQEQQDER